MLTRTVAAMIPLAFLIFAADISPADAATQAACHMRLRVVVSPDVAYDATFLNSLLGNHSGYQLTPEGNDPESGSAIALLTGPGAEGDCGAVVEAMRTDPRIVSLEVQPEGVSTAKPAPDGQLYVYPKNEASYAQQARDRHECDIAAVEQTGFDPTEEDGGVAPNAAPARRAEYFRAQAACLEARAYRVR
jgi:hypothetical protein